MKHTVEPEKKFELAGLNKTEELLFEKEILARSCRENLEERYSGSQWVFRRRVQEVFWMILVRLHGWGCVYGGYSTFLDERVVC